MRLATVHEGDIVAADVRGERFYGIVTDDVETGPREIAVRPIGNGRERFPRIVTPRQVVDHWRKRKARAT
jgi:hypothetical protein